MATLAQIVGQARAVEILAAAVSGGKVHHAYLFEGPGGVGKASCARALAMALNCERGGLGCGACTSCEKIAAGTHPDVITFDMTPKGLTERVREVQALVGFRPHEGRARVVIFDPADDLAGAQERAEPANVLLKTLEEPPPGTHFVLCTAQPRRLPVTVRSRCQRIRFLPLEDAVLEAWLVEHAGASPAQAARAAAQAGGSLGRALTELGEAGEEAPSPRERVRALVEAARRADPKTIFDTAAGVGQDRGEADQVLSLLQAVLRDALLYKEGLHRGRVSPERVDFAAQLLGDRASASLFGAIEAAREAQQALKGNVAPALVLEHLMLRLAPERRA